MDYIRAFLAGGVICALVQILMEKTKMIFHLCSRQLVLMQQAR